MAYVPVPKDLTKVKTKVAFNLTKRQLIFFAAALALGLPLFFLLKNSAGTSLAAMVMINIIARPKRLWYNKPYTITPDFSAMVYFKENGGEKQ